MATTAVDIVVKVAGGQKLDSLQNKLDRTKTAVNELQDSIKKQGAANSLLKQKLTALTSAYSKLQAGQKKLAATEPTDPKAKFKLQQQTEKLKELKREIDSTKASLRSGLNLNIKGKRDLDILQEELRQTQAEFNKTSRLANKAGKAIKKVGNSNVARGIGAAGAFGGLPGSGLITGIGAGGLAGGPAGAIAAGVTLIGAAAVKTGNQIAVFNSEIQRAEISLRNVAGVNTAQAFEAIGRVVEDFNAPVKEATQNFTSLLASTDAAGFSVSQTETVFRALAAANKALGGDAEKLNGILLATTQVFSKGKVTAEELRGQIGERLPGAFALFAKATGRSTAQLDQDLQDGKVSLNDFVTFTESLLLKYEGDAQKIADGPTDAGARLEKELQGLGKRLGPIFSRLGAQFQEFATQAIKELSRLFDFLGSVGNEVERRLGNLKSVEFINENRAIAQKSLEKLLKEQAETVITDTKEINRLQGLIDIQLNAIKGFDAQLDKLKLGPQIPEPPKPPVTEIQTDKDKKPKRDRLKRLESVIGPDFAKAAAINTQKALNENSQKRLEALKAGNTQLVEELDITRELIPLTVRREALEAALTKFQSRRNELLGKGFTEEQIISGEKEVQQALNLTNERIESKRLDIANDLADANRREREEKEKRLNESKQGLKDEIRRLEIGDEAFQREKERARLLSEGFSVAEVDAFFAKFDKLKAIKEETAEIDALFSSIGDTIENGIISAIDAGINSLVDGTKSLDKALQEIASGVLKDIGNQLIRFGVNAAFNSLGNSGGLLGQLFGGGRAEGGSVSPDKTFLVGEKGPELFTPTTNGTIIPNDFFNSAREALRSPDSGSVASDNPEAFAAAAAAIQRNTTNINNRQSAISQETSFNNFAETLGSQQRETIRFETVRVGEMDMVTKDEALKIGAESAKAAEASVFNALKNKPSVRKSIGMS